MWMELVQRGGWEEKSKAGMKGKETRNARNAGNEGLNAGIRE